MIAICYIRMRPEKTYEPAYPLSSMPVFGWAVLGKKFPVMYNRLVEGRDEISKDLVAVYVVLGNQVKGFMERGNGFIKVLGRP